MAGYFSGPRTVSQWDATGGALGGLKSRIQGQATNAATRFATQAALSGLDKSGVPWAYGDAVGQNTQLANQAKDRRFEMRTDNMASSLTAPANNHYGNDSGPAWDAFFESLRGKNVDLGGFGRTVDYDVPTGRSYNRDAGEIAPGMRGSIQAFSKIDPQFAYGVTAGMGPDFKPSRGGFYTPEELGGMDSWQRARIGYENSLGRIQRGY